jgi:microcystin-dependent protein
MASLTNIYANYRSTSTDYTGRTDVKSTAGSLSTTINQMNVTAYVPTGSVLPFAGSNPPPGFFVCDGSAISRLTYAYLFEIIGTTYGVGDGSTTFNIPNLKGRVVVCIDSSQSEFDTLGETGGTKVETLTIDQMPSHNHGGITQSAGVHNHPITDKQHTHTSNATGATSIGGNGFGLAYSDGEDTMNAATNSTAGEPNLYATVAALNINSSFTGITETENAGSHQHVIDSQGGGQSHNNLQPYFVLNYIIRI